MDKKIDEIYDSLNLDGILNMSDQVRDEIDEN